MSWFGEFLQKAPDGERGLVDDLDAAFDAWSTEVEEEFFGRDLDDEGDE